MGTRTLFDEGGHRNVWFEDLSAGDGVPANNHLIVHGGQGFLLDAGGRRVFAPLLPAVEAELGGRRPTHLFFSHQDPDVVASIEDWLTQSDATAWVPAPWLRFVPHFGARRLPAARVRGIPDAGQVLDLGGCALLLLPAHWLHSPGNFQVFDPISKILYSGDLGASVSPPYDEVPDFEAHRPLIEPFHARYMTSNRALKAWAAMVRTLDVEVIAPQHGALFRGRPMVERFLAWAEGFACGVDLLPERYRVPES